MRYDMASSQTAATGGMRAPAPPAIETYPEDTPMLLDPTARPSEPVTSGVPTGPGPGPEALDPRLQETANLKRFLPIIEPFLSQPDTPESVVALVKYIKGS
jgi:hypothetical protein